MEPNDTPENSLSVRTPVALDRATFATGAFVESGRMVWLDFVQALPSAPKDKPIVTVVARIVLDREGAQDLAERLSELDTS